MAATTSAQKTNCIAKTHQQDLSAICFDLIALIAAAEVISPVRIKQRKSKKINKAVTAYVKIEIIQSRPRTKMAI